MSLTLCGACQEPLEPAGPLGRPHCVNTRHPFTLVFHNVPSLRCPRCGKTVVPAAARDTVQRVYDLLARELATGARHLTSLGVPREQIDPAALRRVDVSLGRLRAERADEQERKEPGLLVEEPATALRLATVVMPAPLKRALSEFLAGVRHRERIAAALGGRLADRQRRHYLDLSGPTGTGKTTAARILAAELGVPLLRLDAAAVTSSKVGDTEKALRAAFAEARARPCALLVDEADTLLSRRLSASSGHEEWINGVRNTIIQELDRHEGVVLLSTNRREAYDPAIDRRLEHLAFPAPSAETRRELWRWFLDGARVAPAPDAAFVQELDAQVAEHERLRGDPQRPFGPDDVQDVLCAAARKAAEFHVQGELEISRVFVREALAAHLAELSAARARQEDAPQVQLEGYREVVAMVLRGETELARALETALAEASARAPSHGEAQREQLVAVTLQLEVVRKAAQAAVDSARQRSQALRSAGLPARLDAKGLRRLREALRAAGLAEASLPRGRAR